MKKGNYQFENEATASIVMMAEESKFGKRSKERVLSRRTVVDSKECEGSPVQRNAKGRQEVKWSLIQRNAKGCREVEWSLIRRKAKGRRFEGMRRVAIELNRRRLALNGASSAMV